MYMFYLFLFAFFYRNYDNQPNSSRIRRRYIYYTFANILVFTNTGGPNTVGPNTVGPNTVGPNTVGPNVLRNNRRKRRCRFNF